MPEPLARCALSRSSGGTSTVILRAVSMTPQYTIPDTSIEYGLAEFRILAGQARTHRHRTFGWDCRPAEDKLCRVPSGERIDYNRAPRAKNCPKHQNIHWSTDCQLDRSEERRVGKEGIS